MSNKKFIIRLKKKSKWIIKFRASYHKKFYVNNIGGPGLHYHMKSIREKDFEQKIEYIYAVLVSWGMHRMGKVGPKMVDFEKFRYSIKKRSIINSLEKLKKCRIEHEFNEWKDLKNIFRGIKIMNSSKCILVGNSKVMAHLLPNLVPPIDRQYTLQYCKGSKSVPKEIDDQWNLFKNLIQNFFIPIARDENFLNTARKWKKCKKYMSDTSMPKIIDNLIMGTLKKP